MFDMCKTCGTAEETKGPAYLVKKDLEAPKYYSDYKSINQGYLNDPNTTLLKVARSSANPQLQHLSKNKPFTDPQFQLNEASLGQFPNVTIDKWKRISELTSSLKLYGTEVEPRHAVSFRNEKMAGFQAAVACLAQKPQRIKNIFGQQKYSESGAYTVFLRHKGEIEEVAFDDYIPVDDSGQPLFSRPVHQSTWPMLLQKARAKVHGSYEKMVQTSKDPRFCLQELTYAPTETVPTQATNKDNLWLKLVDAAKNRRPMIGHTYDNNSIQWKGVGLTANHYYTVIDAVTLQHKLGNQFKIIKLRNAFENEIYDGEGSVSDNLFWDQVENDRQKSRILSTQGCKDGIIFILFSDYVKYFESTFINQSSENTKYISEELVFQPGVQKHGLLHRLQIQKQGNYTISVDQNDMSTVNNSNPNDGWSRVTILLIKDLTSKVTTDYQYVDGVLKYNEQFPSLKVTIPAGNYYIYTKIDPTIRVQAFPTKTSLLVSSCHPAYIKQISRNEVPGLIERVFMDHARGNKRQFYNNDLMWSSWKLIAQGGYGYIAFGNAPQSKFKYVIRIDKQLMFKQNFAVKHPIMDQVIQTIQVMPGQGSIILLRICNSEVREVNFPPPIDLQILPIL